MKKLSLAAIVVIALLTTACSNNENMEVISKDAPMANAPRSLGDKIPKLAVYIETDEVNPLNAGEYYFCGTKPKDYVVDYTILSASSIRGTASNVQLYHNMNQTYILNHANELIRPLQDKGIKVLLGLVGGHTGVGFANLTSTQIESFAQQLANCVMTYGLDGVDFDDEYAEYGRISGTPSPSGTNFSRLIQALRIRMPNKLITAFYYGFACDFSQNAKDVLDYMWTNFGVSNAPTGFSNNKWARLSIHYTYGIPSISTIQSVSKAYAGYGAIMMFNLRDYDASGTMNNFAPYIWEGKNVCWTGIAWPKNY